MNSPPRRAAAPKLKLSSRATLAIVLALVAYVMLRPWLQEKFGIPLPALVPDQQFALDKGPPPVRPGSRDAAPADDAPTRDVAPGTSPSSAADHDDPSTPGDDADKSTEPVLGKLTEIGGERLRSTAGLIYKPLRSEHRLEHVLRHATDDPSRPVHGVFTGDRAEILAVIDEAWLFARKGRPPQVERTEEGDRTELVVDLGRKIGYMGGQAGQRRNFPPCRHVQLVVEGNEVVTAYPVIPR